MDASPKAGERRVQILSALHLNGPLSLTTLQKLIKPAMSSRRLQEVTKRLLDRKLILRYHDSIHEKSVHYFQISQSKSARKCIASWLNIDPEKLIQKHFRGQELKHGEQCALWGEKIVALFPEAKVGRYFYVQDGKGSKNGDGGFKRDESVPDIVLEFPAGDGLEKIVVGFEIERTRKNSKRATEKIRGLVSKTNYDGMVYICGSDLLAEKIRDIFSKQLFSKSKRVGHYWRNFMLFSSFSNTDSLGSLLVNVELFPVDLVHWIHKLRTTPLYLRRDIDFDFPAKVRWEIDEEF